MPRIAIIVSRFNADITHGLLQGALNHLAAADIQIPPEDIYDAPGAFELPLIAQALARTALYQGIICLGCVIKGDTAHFEFISLAASIGLMTTSLATETPITFGILTTYTDEQANLRSRADSSNKGLEAASACLEAIATLQKIKAKTEGRATLPPDPPS